MLLQLLDGERLEGAQVAALSRLLVYLDDVLTHRLPRDERLAAFGTWNVPDVPVHLHVIVVAVFLVCDEAALVAPHQTHLFVDDLVTAEHVRCKNTGGNTTITTQKSLLYSIA